MARDVTLVPRDEDRLDVWEVLVQGRTPDPGFLGDLRHRHRSQPALGDEGPSRVEDRVSNGAAVRVDRFVPESWHRRSIRTIPPVAETTPMSMSIHNV